jgi:putative spermidine/putrescine transport system permease protein
VRARRWTPWTALTWLVAVIYGFMFGPILITAAVSFNSVEQSRFPPSGFSLRWWYGVLDPRWLEPLQFSLELSMIAAVAATALGLPLAFALARHEFRGRRALATLALSPLMLPALVTGIGLLQLLELAGLGDLLGLPALVVGHVVICLPFVVRTIAISLGSVSRRVEDAARSLGATNTTVLIEITFPLIKGGLFAGATFAFIQSFTDYSMSLFLTSPADRPITITILNYIEYGFTPTLAAVAVVSLIIPLVLVLIVQRFFRVADFIEGAPTYG